MIQQGFRPALKPGRSKPCPLNRKRKTPYFCLTVRRGVAKMEEVYVLVILLMVVGSSAWVYSDATARHKRKKSFFNPGKPLAWALHCLLLWIVFFPIYLGRRAEFKKPILQPSRILNKNHSHLVQIQSLNLRSMLH